MNASWLKCSNNFDKSNIFDKNKAIEKATTQMPVSMTLIIVAIVMIAGALAFMSIQKSHAQLKVIQSEQQQKLGQLNDCGNNATCTNIGSLSFMISSQATNDTKLNYIARQANSIKDYAQKDTTPFILPFPWVSFFWTASPSPLADSTARWDRNNVAV